MNDKISKGDILIAASIILGSIIISGTIYYAISKLVSALTLLI